MELHKKAEICRELLAVSENTNNQVANSYLLSELQKIGRLARGIINFARITAAKKTSIQKRLSDAKRLYKKKNLQTRKQRD